MLVIGLTGGICSGKSTVCGFLTDLGAAFLSADKIGHEAYEPFSIAWQSVVDGFGEGILKEGYEIDRQKLGEIVFNDPEAMARLNQIMHPAIRRMTEERIEKLKREGVSVAVFEAPLLIEANWLDLVDQVWVVTASEETVVRRCSERSGLDEAQARARIASQLSNEERIKYADQVINNDLSIDEVRARVKGLWDGLCGLESIKERIRQALSRRDKKVCDPGDLVRAAVLVPIFERAGDCHILFTKRTETVNHHKGQISFPGGVQEVESESHRDAALRESWEEIGLDPKDVEILGELDDIATYTTRFIISPFVGAIPHPYEFRTSPEEVEEVISVPLEVLLDKGNFKEDIQSIGGSLVPQYYFYYDERVIWGATARILKQFLEVVFGF